MALEIESPDSPLLLIIEGYLQAYKSQIDLSPTRGEVKGSLYLVHKIPKTRVSPLLFNYCGIRGYTLDDKLILEMDGAKMELSLNNCSFTGWVTDEGMNNPFALCYLWLKIGLMILLSQLGCYYIHGAALQTDKEGWLFVGESGAGKSTITKIFLEEGFNYSSDDALLLREINNKIECLGFIERGRPSFGYSNYNQRVTPANLVFTEIAPQYRSRLFPITPIQAMPRLIPSSVLIFLESTKANVHLKLLRDLVQQCRTFCLTMGKDLKENPKALKKILGI